MITTGIKGGRNIITSIAHKGAICMVSVIPDVRTSPAEFLGAIFDILGRKEITPFVMTTSTEGTVMAVSDSEAEGGMLDELSSLGAVNTARDKGAISLVGENIRTVPDFASLVLRNLNGTGIDMVAYGVSPISCTIVVSKTDIPSVIARLHGAFFRDPDPDLFG